MLKPIKLPKEFIYNELKHLPIARRYLKDGKELIDLCKRLHVTIKKLYELGKTHPQFGFIVQRIASYSYIPEGEQVYHVEVPWISKFDPTTHVNQLVDLYKEGKTTAQICTLMRISRFTYDMWRGNFKVFEDAHQYGKQCFQAYWEDVLTRGFKGEISGFNSAAVTFFLRNQCKDDYADVKNIATTSSNNLTILTDDDLKRRLLAKLSESKLLENIPYLSQNLSGNIVEGIVVETTEDANERNETKEEDGEQDDSNT